MAQGLISKKYLIDIAEAIRVKLGSSDTYTPSEMATAIANISGGSGTITKSTNTDVGLITDTLMDGICDALRSKLGTQDTYTPSEIADAILTISGGGGGIVPWSTGTGAEIAAMLQSAHNGDIDLQTDGGWAVGDERTIHIDAFTTVDGNNETIAFSAQDATIVISAFTPYYGSNALMQFDFKNCLVPNAKIGSSGTNAGDVIQSSKIFTTLLPALASALPTWLSDSLMTFTQCGKRNYRNGSAGWEAHEWSIANCKLGLRSFKEVGLSHSNFPWESSYVSAIPLYSNADYRKKKQGESGEYGTWWVSTTSNRDSAYSNARYYGYVNSSGGASGWRDSSVTARGVSPFGCL